MEIDMPASRLALDASCGKPLFAHRRAIGQVFAYTKKAERPKDCPACGGYLCWRVSCNSIPHIR